MFFFFFLFFNFGCVFGICGCQRKQSTKRIGKKKVYFGFGFDFEIWDLRVEKRILVQLHKQRKTDINSSASTSISFLLDKC